MRVVQLTSSEKAKETLLISLVNKDGLPKFVPVKFVFCMWYRSRLNCFLKKWCEKYCLVFSCSMLEFVVIVWEAVFCLCGSWCYQNVGSTLTEKKKRTQHCDWKTAFREAAFVKKIEQWGKMRFVAVHYIPRNTLNKSTCVRDEKVTFWTVLLYDVVLWVTWILLDWEHLR